MLEEVVVGLRSHENSGSALVVYPNPAKNLLTVDFSGLSRDVREIVLADMLGAPVYSSGALTGKKSRISFSAGGIANGVYVLSVKTDDGLQINRRVAIVH